MREDIMNWQEEYKRKLISSEEAAAKIKSFDRLVIGAAGVNEPSSVLEALAARKDELEGVTVYQMLGLLSHKIYRSEMKDSFVYNSMYLTGPAHKVVQEGRGTYTPASFSQIPVLWEREIQVDWAITGVSRPDKNGYFSYSLFGCCYSLPAARNAKRVMVCVKDKLPFIYGDTMMHVSEVDCIVEDTHPLFMFPDAKPTEEEARIGAFIAEHIENESTIQLGIGGVPDAAASLLTEKKDLGVHTEMFTPRMVSLHRDGVITNRKKTFHRNKMIGALAVGSPEICDFLRENPYAEMYPISYTNSLPNIARNRKMVSVNAALEVDLTGQVCSESLGTLFYTGSGGGHDHARGILETEDGKGKGFIALESTARGEHFEDCCDFETGSSCLGSKKRCRSHCHRVWCSQASRQKCKGESIRPDKYCSSKF
jgi:4-hydroxybutyrate CoA-transferase